MTSQLIIKNLSKVYSDGNKKITALSGIDITVNSGEFVAIIGPNGCGKSTLLKIIAGIIPPTSGDITIRGETSYLPQENTLLPWQSVEENMYLPSDIKHLPRETVKKKVDHLLKEFGLTEFGKNYPSALSGGLKQKAAIARTIINHPDLLLFDEPFSALDAITRLEFQRWLKKLIKQISSTVLLVTHDIHEAIFLADTIYVVSKRPGKIKKKIDVSKHSPKDLEKELFKLLIND